MVCLNYSCVLLLIVALIFCPSDRVAFQLHIISHVQTYKQIFLPSSTLKRIWVALSVLLLYIHIVVRSVIIINLTSQIVKKVGFCLSSNNSLFHNNCSMAKTKQNSICLPQSGEQWGSKPVLLDAQSLLSAAFMVDASLDNA